MNAGRLLARAHTSFSIRESIQERNLLAVMIVEKPSDTGLLSTNIRDCTLAYDSEEVWFVLLLSTEEPEELRKCLKYFNFSLSHNGMERTSG